eukprot:TRINITY_DN14838_c0_g2_i1.p1 TRINITY_DN14838_c0_g2~~TRINITY_DN14838_c0_g2_i1.p1  ORF type:complete len:233 (-),score=60.14 TRINITY_DN14838_c0_g2_i1:9-707(-)
MLSFVDDDDSEEKPKAKVLAPPPGLSFPPGFSTLNDPAPRTDPNTHDSSVANFFAAAKQTRPMAMPPAKVKGVMSLEDVEASFSQSPTNTALPPGNVMGSPFPFGFGGQSPARMAFPFGKQMQSPFHNVPHQPVERSFIPEMETNDADESEENTYDDVGVSDEEIQKRTKGTEETAPTVPKDKSPQPNKKKDKDERKGNKRGSKEKDQVDDADTKGRRRRNCLLYTSDAADE